MSFLHVNLLVAGLCCVSLPILIHILLRRRRQPVMWGAMRFLLEAYQQQRRKVQLEQLLILACRCLIVALIGFAIARPFFPSSNPLVSRNARTMYIVLDDSLTSSATDAAGKSDFAALQAAAAELIKDLDPSRGDKAALITLAAPAEAKVSPPSTDPGAVMRLIATMSPNAAGADWNQALTLASEAIVSQRGAKDTSTPVLALLTKGRAGSIDAKQALAKFPALPADSIVLVSPPAVEAVSNTAIMDISPLRPVLTAAGVSGQDLLSVGQVRVSLKRFGTLSAAANKVRLEVETIGQKGRGQDVTEHAVTWNQGQAEQAIVMNGPRLAANDASKFPILTATIDRDAIEGDNTFRSPLIARDALHAALVASRADSKLLSGGAIGSVDQFSPGDWIWIGLDPAAPTLSLTERGGDLQRTWVDPSALGATMLSDFDILIVVAPDRVDRDGWKRLRQAVDAGAVLMVFPAETTSAQTWSDAMIETLKIDLQVGREPRVFDTPLPLAWNSAERPTWDPLRAIAPEAQELFKPVRVSKLLALSSAAGQPMMERTILAAEGNLPLLVALTPQDERASRGVVFVAGAPMTPTWTDLPTRALFVPLLQEMMRSGMARASLDSKQVAGRSIKVPAGAASIRLAQNAAAIPVETASNTAAAVRDAQAIAAADSRGAVIASLAMNADTNASDVGVQSKDEAVATFRSLADASRLRFTDAANAVASETSVASDGSVVREPPSRVSLWLFAIAAAVGLLELVLGRIFSHAQPSRVKSVLDVPVSAEAMIAERAA